MLPCGDKYLSSTANLLGIDLAPEQCVVVEDSERGLASARAAGVEYLIVLSEWTKDGDFSQACICPGIKIGAGSTIGAGSVVTKDVPEGVFAAGNPCRVIRDVRVRP